MRILVLVFISTLALFTARPAHAGLLLEPYLGYQFGKYESGSSSLDLSTAAVGARVGVTFPLIFIAADYQIPVSGTAKDSSGNKWDVVGAELFADVGVSLPLIRAYAGYGLTNTFDLKFNGAESKAENGTSFKLGVGTTIFPLIAINLEYCNTNYDKVNGTSVSDTKSNFYMLSVSLPFNL